MRFWKASFSSLGRAVGCSSRQRLTEDSGPCVARKGCGFHRPKAFGTGEAVRELPSRNSEPGREQGQVTSFPAVDGLAGNWPPGLFKACVGHGGLKSDELSFL